MNVFSKQRLIGALLVGLVVVNVGLLGTIWTQLLKEPPETVSDTQHFMEKELRLTEPQTVQFENLRVPHLVGSKQLLDDIHDLKQAITAELFATEPNVENVAEMAAQIGEKYAELEQLRFHYFLDMRQLVEPEQQEQLEELMGDLLQTVKPPPLPQGMQSPPGQPGGRPPGESQPGQPGPPQEAIDACSEYAEGEACQFNAPHGVITGTCRMREQLACVPDSGMIDSPPERGRPPNQPGDAQPVRPGSPPNQRPAP